MFIYKITVIPTNKCYIGFDSSPSYKLVRWKAHCRNIKTNNNTKLYAAMSEAGIENCRIEIVEDNFTSVSELALAEVNYIKKFDTFKNGLNSTSGGDGLGRHILHKLSESDIKKIKQALGDSFSNYNKTIKWANTTVNERKLLTQHLNTPEVIARRTQTLIDFYVANPEAKKLKGDKIKQWQQDNKSQLAETNRINGLKGAQAVSKKLVVEKLDGTMLYFNSKSEFNRQTGQWAETVLRKTQLGEFHNGFKAWECK